MTLARRMWLASAALALLVGAAFTALILAVSAQREATDREARSKDVTAASLQLERLVSDIESSFLSFTVTGSDGVARLLPGRAAGSCRRSCADAGAARARTTRDQSARARAIENQVREYVYFFVPTR